MKHQPWQFTLRGLFLFTLSVALGLSFWKMEHASYLRALKAFRGPDWELARIERREWFVGVLAALSFWIVLGLVSQVRDLWSAFRQIGNPTCDVRWGWRFPIAWRLAACSLIVSYFVFQMLIALDVLARHDQADFYRRCVPDAALLIVFISAAAGTPRFKRRTRKCTWLLDLLGAIAGSVILIYPLRGQLFLAGLVHVTVVGIQMAQPLEFSADFLPTLNPARTTRLIVLSTAGMVALPVSLALLRLFVLDYWTPGRRRACLGALLAASLTVAVLAAGSICLVDAPGVAPIMVASIPTPTLPEIIAAASLLLLLAVSTAHRWSKRPAAPSFATTHWRGDDRRYYHEHRFLILALATAALSESLHRCYVLCFCYGSRWLFAGGAGWRNMAGSLKDTPLSWLSIALLALAVQGLFSARPGRSRVDESEISPCSRALFLLAFLSTLAIVLCAPPIMAAWGFAYWLPRY